MLMPKRGRAVRGTAASRQQYRLWNHPIRQLSDSQHLRQSGPSMGRQGCGRRGVSEQQKKPEASLGNRSEERLVWPSDVGFSGLAGAAARPVTVLGRRVLLVAGRRRQQRGRVGQGDVRGWPRPCTAYQEEAC